MSFRCNATITVAVAVVPLDTAALLTMAAGHLSTYGVVAADLVPDTHWG